MTIDDLGLRGARFALLPMRRADAEQRAMTDAVLQRFGSDGNDVVLRACAATMQGIVQLGRFAIGLMHIAPSG